MSRFRGSDGHLVKSAVLALHFPIQGLAPLSTGSTSTSNPTKGSSLQWSGIGFVLGSLLDIGLAVLNLFAFYRI